MPSGKASDRVFGQAVEAFERWATISPGQPRALEELSDALLFERTRLEVAAPERLQTMAEEVLEYASRAAELYADTASERLVRLSNLHLAAGQVDVAIDLAMQAVSLYSATGAGGLGAAPGSLMNVLVVGGQTVRALAVGSGYPGTRRVPGNGQLISLATEPIIERIKVLGAVGVRGPLLRTELDSLTSTWNIAGYSIEEQQILRNWVTLRDGIAAGLVADSAALTEWGESVTVEDPLWNAVRLIYDDPVRAEEHYAHALDQEPDGVPRKFRAFILGSVAGKLGLDAEAIRHYSKLDSLPYGVSRFDSGWGLQVLSRLLRAEHHENLGDEHAALRGFRSFLEARRAWSDSLSLPQRERALRGIARVESRIETER